ncbi:MAG: glycosyltransferase family 2 protein [Deltaproteobacteria bacterium]|nr:glycosyltransferase family 2 protein [Deltaproteobacteria bacterium]
MIDNGSVIPYSGTEPTVRLDPNQGFSRGMNAGLRAAFANSTTDSVLLLSNDAELAADFFAALELLPQTPAPVILCPAVYYLSDRSKPAYTHGKLEKVTGALSHHFDPAMTQIQFPDYYPAAATLWNRAAFERLGGFDERYFCYWEDVELSLRCQQLAVQLLPAPTLRIHHLGRGTTGGKKSYSGHFERGRALTMEILNSRG